MTNYKDLSLTKLFNVCEKQIKDLHKNVIKDFYSEITDEEHLKIKVYQSIDRINMWIATEIAKETFYSFDLNTYLQNRNRKMIMKIINGIEDLTYADVRNEWHKNHKELFYKQKESIKIQEKLSRICVIARLKEGVYAKEGFIRVFNGHIEITNSIAEATEFNAFSDQNDSLEHIEELIKKSFNLKVKTFFNNKIKGRNVHLSI